MVLADMCEEERHHTDFSLTCIFSSTLLLCAVNRSV